MGPLITCTCAGVYALKRGKQYELLAHDTEKDQVRLRGDLERIRWFPAHHFDLSGGSVPVLADWCFDDPVISERNGWDETYNWVNVTLTFDDATQRWCQMAPPEYIRGLMTHHLADPMVYAKNLIIVRDLVMATVSQVLAHMDQQGELLEFSLSLEPSEQPE